MKKVIGVLVGFALIPLAMWLGWYFTPVTPLQIKIVDKTVLTRQATEHESFTWILIKEKFAKANGKLYEVSKDYFGFFPGENQKYAVRGLEQFTLPQIDSLARRTDVAYFTDTYGIYRNEWFTQTENLERSKSLYGGLSARDLAYLTALKKRKKLILTEFNTLASPTQVAHRRQFENLFGLRWTGWVGRYFSNLDTLTNNELPRWLTHNYRLQHGNKWPFKKAGIVFVREDDFIEVLEKNTHLRDEVPTIKTFPEYRDAYSLPEQVDYPFWFDIMMTKRSNQVLATYSIKTTAKGDSILNKYNILKTFPAVIAHDAADYRFYYFAGDFADNNVNEYLPYFKGIEYLGSFFYNPRNRYDRSTFFWTFYIPLITSILDKNQPRTITSNNKPE